MAERQARLGEALGDDGSPRVIRGEHRPGARQQMLCGGRVGPAQCALARVRQAIPGAHGERPDFQSDRAALLDGLLQVISGDLVELGRRIGRLGLQPVGEPLVQSRAVLAGHALVRGLPDQPVTEPKAAIAACDEPLGLQRLQMPFHERPGALGDERRQRILREVRPDDGGAAEQVPLARAEPVEPRGEQALQRGRDRLEAGLGKRGEQLLGEERVPLRGLDDPSERLRRRHRVGSIGD